jgi:RNA polymerase sigma-70 factor, ECF subfamily
VIEPEAREAKGLEALVERARRGEAAAFTALVRRFDPMLRGLAFNVLGDRELMDDALQEAYLRAFRALPAFEGRAPFGVWLCRIAYNACVDELRGGRRRRWLPLGEPALKRVRAPGVDLDEQLALAGALRDALAGLSHADRAAVWLVDAQGHDYRSAAAVLGVAEGTVGSRLNRARAVLRRALSEEVDR